MSNDINKSLSDINNSILTSAKNNIPLSSSKFNKKKVPWWNLQVASAITNKKRAFKHYRQYPTIDNQILFKKARAQARRLILEAKTLSWRNYVSSISSDRPSNELWNKIKYMHGYKKSSCVNILNIDNSLSTNREDIVECLAAHFESVSSTDNYSLRFLNIKNSCEVPLDFSSDGDELYNRPFSMNEFNLALSKTKNTSVGPDQISYLMLKHLTFEMKSHILDYFNFLWHSGEYPDAWREAIVVPIPKPNKDVKQPTNYRPISLTSHLSKLYERMINYRLVWFLEYHRLLDPLQCGSRKSYSTTDLHVHLTNAIHCSFLARQHLVAVFFDLEKAFDMTWRYGILKQLHDWGLRGNLPNFLTSFFQNRTFKVRVGDVYSSSHPLENGVPQGSTISVVLFMIAINSIALNLPPTVHHCLYVDDLVIFTSASNIPECEFRIQNAINSVSDLATTRGFRFSVEKTKCIDFCRLRTPHNNPSLLLYGTPIQCTNRVKFLGLILDTYLTWKHHILNLAAECRKVINAIKCLSSTKWGDDRDCLIRIYTSLVMSKFDYGSVVLSTANQCHLKRLDAVHNAGIRLSIGAYRTSPVNSLYCDSGLPSLFIRRTRQYMRYTARLRSKPWHFLFNILFQDDHSADLFYNSTTSLCPLAVKLLLKFDELPQGMEDVLPQLISETPNWCLPDIRTDFRLTKFKKDVTPHSLYVQEFYHLMNNYPNVVYIYTDGSKTNVGTGCSFIFNDEKFIFSLSPTCSVFSAELYAILFAVQHCSLKVELEKNIVVCSDSLSALLGITNCFTSDPLIQEIHSVIFHLYERNIHVTFIWIPGHVGIQKNHVADEAAREGASSPYTTKYAVRPDDLLITISEYCLSLWQSEWSRSSDKLWQIKKSVEKWKEPIPLTRKEQVAITRLRIGHIKLTHLHLLLGQPAPLCDTCNVQQSVEHVLINCPKFQLQRSVVGQNNTLESVLSNDKGTMIKLLEFLNTTKLIGDII